MTRLADALAGVTRIGFDTASFVSFVERHPSYLDVKPIQVTMSWSKRSFIE